MRHAATVRRNIAGIMGTARCATCQGFLSRARAKGSGYCSPCYYRQWRAKQVGPVTPGVCACGAPLTDPRTKECRACHQRGDLDGDSIEAIIAAELERIAWRRRQEGR